MCGAATRSRIDVRDRRLQRPLEKVVGIEEGEGGQKRGEGICLCVLVAGCEWEPGSLCFETENVNIEFSVSGSVRNW
jgi:hypothetical protein